MAKPIYFTTEELLIIREALNRSEEEAGHA